MVDACDASASRQSFPSRHILGVSFFADSLDKALEDALRGGLVLAPSGPGLANDLTRDQYDELTASYDRLPKVAK